MSDTATKRAQVDQLVRRHSELEEPMVAAIRLPDEAEMPKTVWLVEVLDPSDGPGVAPMPYHFNPTPSFGYPLAMVVGSEADISAAIDERAPWTERLAEAEVVWGDKALLGRLLSRLHSASAA
jgi:hypothetical protein